MTSSRPPATPFDALLELCRDPAALCDGAGRILRCNAALERLTGLNTSALTGRRLNAEDPVFTPAGPAEARAGGWRQTLRVHSAGGSTVVAELDRREVATPADGFHGWLALLHCPEAATTRPRHTQRDAMTGLPGRMLFDDRLTQSLIVARRSNRPVALMLIGLDRFSLVNDGFGPHFGDLILRQMAERLDAAIRRSDTAAYLDGDRFGLIMPVTQDNDAMTVADKLLAAMERPFLLEGHEITVGASIGIGLFPNDAEDAGNLFQRAESALRHVKRDGGHAFEFYAEAMNSRARHRLEIENGLRRALANNELRIHYQPKVDSASGSIVGAEALLRWQSPERGLVSPGEFIPVAEESGLIRPIGAWVLQQACAQAQAWRSAGLPPLRVSVNIAAPQFRDGLIVDQVTMVLEETGLPAQDLELEITESLLMSDADKIIGRLKALRGLGVHLAIDDFGTGYSSLSYLSRFPVTTLKIDRAFVTDLQTSPDAGEITRAIIGLSKGLELEVVAEGAEVREQIDFLRRHGCPTVQGFYYSPPVPAAEFERLLRSGYSPIT